MKIKEDDIKWATYIDDPRMKTSYFDMFYRFKLGIMTNSEVDYNTAQKLNSIRPVTHIIWNELREKTSI